MRFHVLGASLGLATVLALSAGCGSTGGDVLTPSRDAAPGSDASRSEGDSPSGGDATVNDATVSDAAGSDASRGNVDGGGNADGGDAGSSDGSGGGAEAAVACGDSGQVCAAPLECTGVACSCLVACDMNTVQRSDGSLWWYPLSAGTPGTAIAVTTQDGSPFLASSFAASQESQSCGVRASDATVWCWDVPACDAGVCAPGADLGNASTASSLSPVQVVTSGNTPLSNVVSVSANDGTSCAVDRSGGAWCWGSGFSDALGTGSTSDSLVATPVLTASGGPPLTDVAEIAACDFRTCARKTDGTVWCWGSLQVSGGNAPFPVQISLSGTAKSLSVDEFTACALMDDTTVWCWGNGGYFGTTTTPSQLLASQGTPFTGVVTVEVDNTTAHAVKSDGSLWVWYTSSPSYAEPQSDFGASDAGSARAVDDVFVLCQSGTASPAYIDTSGRFHFLTVGAVASSVSCP